MTLAQAIAVGVYFGTPLVIVWRWISVGRYLGRFMVQGMLIAMVLWLLQAGVLLGMIFMCIGGHGCNPPPIPEVVVYVIVGGAYLFILLLVALSWTRYAG